MNSKDPKDWLPSRMESPPSIPPLWIHSAYNMGSPQTNQTKESSTFGGQQEIFGWWFEPLWKILIIISQLGWLATQY